MVKSKCLAALATALVVLGVVWPAAAGAGSMTPRCPPAGARTVKQNRAAVIFSLHRHEEAETFYGCSRAGGHAFELGVAPEGYGGGTESAGRGIRHMVLAGTAVAYEQRHTVNATEFFRGKYELVVRDLRNGRTLRKLPTGTLTPTIEGDVGVGPTTAIVLKSNGSLAWIAHATLGDSTYEVHAVDRSGKRTLAEGNDIAPESLRLAGNRLSWRQAGKQFTSTLR